MRRRPPCSMLPVAVLLACAFVPARHLAAADAPAATQASPLDDQRARRAELEAEIRSMAEIPDKKLADVLVLEMDGPALVARSNLAPARFARSFAVEGMPGRFGVTLRSNRRGVPVILQLRRLDTSDPRVTFVHTDLTASDRQLNISCETQGPRFVSLVQFIDDRSNPDPLGPHPEGESRLYVQVSDVADDRPLFRATYIEGDLRTLARRYRAPVDAYLRPALRELGHERLLLPPTDVARQVLNAGAVADDETKRKVAGLVNALDADDYAERRKASDALRQLGPAAVDALATIRRGKLSPEQRSRVEEIIRRDRPLDEQEAEQFAKEPAFLIDCLDLDDATLRAAAKAKLEEFVGERVSFDPAAPDDVRRKAVDAIRERWATPPELRPPSSTAQPTGS